MDWVTYGIQLKFDRAFFAEYEKSDVDHKKIPVVFDNDWEMHVGLVMAETWDSEFSGEQVTIDPENVTELLEKRDTYKTAFKKAFPGHANLVEGEWRIRLFATRSY